MAERTSVTVSAVECLIAEQFPQWADLPIRPVDLDGWDNATFRLGDDMSVRLPRNEQYALQIEKEHRWLPRLAPHLPLPIPEPLARGVPGCGYPLEWSVHRWLKGEPAIAGSVADPVELATSLAGFLAALYEIDATGGPEPGPHNFFRGASPAVYDGETREAIAALGKEVDAAASTEVWEAALDATWRGSPVWVHGDVAAGNLLVKDGRLSAVIDFGSSGVGDPACDVTIAWTYFSGRSRDAFRARLPVDEATWTRGRGWALWKALITLAAADVTSNAASKARYVVDEVLAGR